MKKRLSLLLFLVGCVIIPGIFVKSATAQVTPDGTTNTTVDAQGNDFTIQNGDRAGNNLFHSFQDFSVPTGGSAFFDNAGDIANILSRVTGGNISNIDGLIRANGSANLFLINPAGIIFGEGASLDLGGSFYGSSASSILFEDGEFSATDLENPPLLTINAPIGLGFRDEPRDIVNRSFAQNSAGELVGLEVDPGNTLALIGGDINFEAGEATASGGNIELGGLSEAGTVDINPDGSLSFPNEVTKADINLSNAADVDVRGTGGGSVSVNARNLNLAAGEFGGSFIRAGIRPESTSTEAQAGDVTIDVAENITLDDSRILNQVGADGVGNSGNITINTGSIEAMNGGDIDASTLGQGNAGSVNITASREITFDGEDSFGIPSGATSLAGFNAEGDAGGVIINTPNLTLTNGGRVSASTFGLGNAGLVNITATGDITIDGESSFGFPSGATSLAGFNAEGNAGGVFISTTNLTLTNGGGVDASTFGLGDAGSVDLTATGDITIDGENSDGTPSGATSVVNSGAVGNAGGVFIETANLTLTNGGRVDASTFGLGDAGFVDIIATENITIDGEDSNGFASGVTSVVNSNAVGDAGGVFIETSNLTLTNGGGVDASTLGQGNAGFVDLTATGDITIDGESSFGFPSGATSLASFNAEGNAGGVFISAANLTLTNGGRVDANTSGQGNAGSVNITAKGDINIDGESLGGTPSGATSQVNSSAVGDAGGVTINTANLTLTNGGRVDANTSGQGNAGSVNIDATESILIGGVNAEGDTRSGISANALIENGDGGNVNVFTDQLTIANGGTIDVGNFDDFNASAPGTGEPGNIDIEANNLDLVNTARINAETLSETGEGGNITLRIAEDITLKDNSFISAQALENANGGNLIIDARFIVAFISNGTGNDLVATADRGQGGNIDLSNVEQIFGLAEGSAINDETSDFINNNNNDIDASSNVLGLDGTIKIDSSSINPIQGVTELPRSVVEPEQTVAQTCRSNIESGNKSDLTINGKGGVTPAPDLPLDSQNISINGNVTDSISTIPQPVETSKGKIQPARGVKVTESGKVILTAYRTDNAGERLQIKPNCKNARNLPW